MNDQMVAFKTEMTEEEERDVRYQAQTIASRSKIPQLQAEVDKYLEIALDDGATELARARARVMSSELARLLLRRG